MNEKTASTDSRWQVLALLRFFLALIVASSHIVLFTPRGKEPTISLHQLGAISAVIAFLVISGYSIAHSLARRREGFLRRRILRIYPLYLLSLLFALLPYYDGRSVAVGIRTIAERPTALTFVSNVFMLQNVATPPLNSNPPVWTLGVEFFCYLAAPLLLRIPLFATAGLAIVSATAYASFPWLNQPYYSQLKYALPLALFAWAWLAGFLMYRFQKSWVFFTAVIVVGCAAMSVNHVYGNRYSLLTYSASVLLIYQSPKIPVPRKLRGVLNYLGDLSYPLYLFNIPAYLLFFNVYDMTNPYRLFVSGMMASIAFEFLERLAKPMLTRNRKLVPTAPIQNQQL